LNRMSKKPALGKGLSALIPTSPETEVFKEGIQHCSIDKIRMNPNQPRKQFNEISLASLAETIKSKGILQPLLVRKIGDRYELIAGERRLRASKMAGLNQVPVIVRDTEEADSLEISILENIQREDLNPIEEARGYKDMLDTLFITQDELAQRVGKDRSSVTNTIRLLQLPKEIQQDLIAGELSAGHGRAILGLNNDILQLKVRAAIKKRGLSVRATEKYIQELKEGSRKEAIPLRPDPNLQALQDELSRHFSTRVKLEMGKKGGKIQILCSSPEEMNRICSLLMS